jgi:hypothetical protein
VFISWILVWDCSGHSQAAKYACWGLGCSALLSLKEGRVQGDNCNNIKEAVIRVLIGISNAAMRITCCWFQCQNTLQNRGDPELPLKLHNFSDLLFYLRAFWSFHHQPASFHSTRASIRTLVGDFSSDKKKTPDLSALNSIVCNLDFYISSLNLDCKKIEDVLLVQVLQ